MSIILIGDGVLDNHKEIGSAHKDLTGRLRKKGYRVTNYACDGIRIKHLLSGFHPTEKSRKSGDGMSHPLNYLSGAADLLQGSISGDEDKLVVLSIGGNDIKANKLTALLGAQNLLKVVLCKEAREQMKEIINRIKDSGCRLVLVNLYLPFLGVGSKYARYCDRTREIISGWNHYLQTLAQEEKIPLIDLQTSVNAEDPNNYTSDHNHLSDRGCRTLSKLIERAFVDQKTMVHHA